MPVKKFKDPSQIPSIGQKAGRKGGSTKKNLEAPNPNPPAPTPEGPVPSQLQLGGPATSSLPKGSSNQSLITNGIDGSKQLTAPSTSGRYNKDRLKDSWNSLSGQTMEYLLEVDPILGESRLKTLLRETKLKDIGVLLGISTEKVLLMEGHPTSIVGQAEAKKLDDLLPALLNEVKRRGATVQLTERKAEVKLDK